MALVHEHAGTGLAAVAISSNSAATHPQDGPDRMVEDAKQFGDSSVRRLMSAVVALVRVSSRMHRLHCDLGLVAARGSSVDGRFILRCGWQGFACTPWVHGIWIWPKAAERATVVELQLAGPGSCASSINRFLGFS